MSVTLEPLIADFVAWLAAEPRTYGEALEAWRTSCPRLTVWEEARELLLEPTAVGLAFLAGRA
jgi:hypothetical protein